METSRIEVKAPTWDAEIALVRNCGLLRDLLDERLDLDRLRADDDLGVLELDGHPIYIPRRVHELRETAGQPLHGVPDLRGASASRDAVDAVAATREGVTSKRRETHLLLVPRELGVVVLDVVEVILRRHVVVPPQRLREARRLCHHMSMRKYEVLDDVRSVCIRQVDLS